MWVSYFARVCGFTGEVWDIVLWQLPKNLLNLRLSKWAKSSWPNSVTWSSVNQGIAKDNCVPVCSGKKKEYEQDGNLSYCKQIIAQFVYTTGICCLDDWFKFWMWNLCNWKTQYRSNNCKNVPLKGFIFVLCLLCVV